MNTVWTLNEIAIRLKGAVHGKGDFPVRTLATDSRTLAPSASTLFVALLGERHDGHDYIEELYEHGIRNFLVSRLPENAPLHDSGFCLVEDTLAALQALASARRSHFEGEVVAITGSNGKTIVKEWLYQCLGDSFSVHRSPKSYNSQVGVPLSVWMTGPHHELALIEAGISRPGEMQKLREIIRPQTGIFTNLGSAHQENFSTLEEKLTEKLSLFKGCKKVICRSDTRVNGKPLLHFMKDLKADIVSWSLEGESDYSYTLEQKSPLGTGMELSLDGERIGFHLPFGDDASIENALHVLTFSIDAGFPVDRAVARIARLERVSMRLEMLQGLQGSVVINDTYNADTGGLAAALDLMDQQEKRKGKIVILSDLLQSGMEEFALYSEIAGMIRQKGVEQFMGIGPALMQYRGLFPRNSLFYRDTDEFLQRMDRTRFGGKAVLIKGSRKYGFERITAELQLKTHRTRLEIDLNAMVHNLNYFRSLLHEGVKTMVMVKALSYGTGNVEVASLLQFHKVDYLAVAFIDEGIELRESGIHVPILVLNPDPSGFGPMLDYQLEPEIYSLTLLESLYNKVRYRGLKQYPVHLKLDTGMHRLGIMEPGLARVLLLLKLDEFRLVSVFSHLAASGEPAHDDYTRRQISDFERISATIMEELAEPVDRHILNSAGIERFPDAQFDMVRLGIGLHGISHSGTLQPVSAFKTSISQIRPVPRGETIGYSRRGVVERASRIATIPVGYADGLNRQLGNGVASVWINGQEAPTIGDICMDMTMIDVTGIEVSEGNEVEIFGKHQPVMKLATLAGTIPYEILTSIPERVKRVYLQE